MFPNKNVAMAGKGKHREVYMQISAGKAVGGVTCFQYFERSLQVISVLIITFMRSSESSSGIKAVIEQAKGVMAGERKVYE